MNCFIDSGDGENLENLSTCLGMFSFELFFSMIWANFMMIFKWNPQILKCSHRVIVVLVSHQTQFAKFDILAQLYFIVKMNISAEIRCDRMEESSWMALIWFNLSLSQNNWPAQGTKQGTNITREGGERGDCYSTQHRCNRIEFKPTY